jgi:hypothetical protein
VSGFEVGRGLQNLYSPVQIRSAPPKLCELLGNLGLSWIDRFPP